MLYSDFRNKEVINIRDCKCLGRVCDFVFDECNGCICKIIVCEYGKWLCFFKSERELEINYKDIRQIGPDIILVDINC